MFAQTTQTNRFASYYFHIDSSDKQLDQRKRAVVGVVNFNLKIVVLVYFYNGFSNYCVRVMKTVCSQDLNWS